MFGLILLISAIITLTGFGACKALKWLNNITNGWLVKLVAYFLLFTIIVDILVCIYIVL